MSSNTHLMRVMGGLVTIIMMLGASGCGSSENGSGGGSAGAATSDTDNALGDAIDAMTPEQDVRLAIVAFAGAIAAKDASGACSLLTAEQRRAIVTQVSTALPTVRTCTEGKNVALRAMNEKPLANLRSYKMPVFESVTINGASASVSLRDGRSYELEESGNRWLVSNLRRRG